MHLFLENPQKKTRLISSLLCLCPQQVSCKIATMLSNYCIMAYSSWLLAEGNYPHSLVSVSLFSQKRHLWWYIILGWGKPFLL